MNAIWNPAVEFAVEQYYITTQSKKVSGRISKTFHPSSEGNPLIGFLQKNLLQALLENLLQKFSGRVWN